MSQVQPIRPAATVIIVRDAVDDFEIFMLKRTTKAAFAGGMYVFPGGRVDGDDHLHKYDSIRVGPSEQQKPQQHAMGAEWRGYWVAGIRESFEEAGLLLAYTDDGKLLGYDDDATQAHFDAYRGPLHAGEITLSAICEKENLKLAVDHSHFYNRYVTPLGRPRRFDTRFFIAEAPPTQTGRHDDKETVDSIWISPTDALRRNDDREFDLMGVTRRQLQSLAHNRSKSEVLAAAASSTEFPTFRPELPPDA